MKTVIVGGGAAGASAAARLRRLDESMEIIILEKTDEISIANCGLPYYISNVISERDNILVSTPQKFKSWFNIVVRLNSEVINIDVENKFVELKNLEKITYDNLVLALGASPIIPNFEGMDNSKVFTVRTLSDADKIKEYIKTNNSQKAVVIGGGFIGVEMAENLVELGLKTSLIELSNQIIAPVDFEVAVFAQNEMRKKGVELILSDGVAKFSDNKIVLNSGNTVGFDIVIMAIGVKPEIELVKKLGINTNKGIIVDECMKTSNPYIYAAGDSVEVKDFVNGENALIPLAGPANRQGRIIADNICGINSTYKASQGTAVLKVFDLTVASVGNNEKQLKNRKTQYLKTILFSKSHAGYYPNSSATMFELLFSPNGNILGAQAVGYENVEKNIDVISAIMRNGGTVQDMVDFEHCYAPPYASAKSPINLLGMNAENILKGFVKPAYIEDFTDSILIDVRPKLFFEKETIDGAINLPIGEIRSRISEIPTNKKVVLFCNTGYTSYCASRILIQNGFKNIYSFMGGIELYKEIKKDKTVKESMKMEV